VQAFRISDLRDQQRQQNTTYLEFLRVPALSAGLYQLPAGGSDRQIPHTEDEVYYVLGGRATLRVGDEDQEVEAGSLVFVAKSSAHRFHSISEDLSVLVFFAPAEETLATRDPRADPAAHRAYPPRPA
jgi:mannose-6-phosphate isomerase-like protein (cupin superfamily)